ncbi:MAG: hypothetical protein GY953_06290, partial [bacterium]|nr:hypothetical protein [bacterium]
MISIDTTLALMGVLAAQSYFTGAGPVESEIRTLAQQIYDNVDWPFMVAKESRQLYLGWKPVEERDGPAFGVPDGDGLGHFSGTPGNPQTLDYYTDEAFLLTLLALGSNTNPVEPDIHCAWGREADDTGLIRSWPGSLFTYFALRAFVDTNQADLRPCPETRPVDWLANSRGAFFRVLDHASRNPARLPTYRSDAWGISATENPLDAYHAYGASPVAVNEAPVEDGTVTYYGAVGTITAGEDFRTQALRVLRRAWDRRHWHHRFALPDAIHDNIAGLFPEPARIQIEGESGSGPGVVRERSEASEGSALTLRAG